MLLNAGPIESSTLTRHMLCESTWSPNRRADRRDSGGQYLDGTIDTTRTFYLGKSPSDDVKRAYTRVLQCHIGVAKATFPRGMDADKLVMLGKMFLYE